MRIWKFIYILLILASCTNLRNSQSQTVIGISSLGHEVKSFKSNGKDYWLIDKSGTLEASYIKFIKSEIINYQPVVAILQVNRTNKMIDGFGADYDGTYQVDKVVSLTSLTDFIAGDWVECNNNEKIKITQGFSLKNNGTAISINMATLQYDKWKIDNNTITLSGTSIGNHQNIQFNEKYLIEIINKNSVFLIKNNYKRQYIRLTP